MRPASEGTGRRPLIEVSRFYRIHNIFQRTFLKAAQAQGLRRLGLQFNTVYHLHCIGAIFYGLQYMKDFIAPTCYQKYIVTHCA